jgi:hypothetical protein
MTPTTTIETKEDLQLRVNQSLVELDNLITALKFLKEEAETSDVNISAAVEIVFNTNTALLRNALQDYFNRTDVVRTYLIDNLETSEEHIITALQRIITNDPYYLREGIVTYCTRTGLMHSAVQEFLNQDNGRRLFPAIENFFLNNDNFYTRFLNWFKRHQLPDMTQKFKTEIEGAINDHLEQFIYANLDQRIEMALAKKKTSANS